MCVWVNEYLHTYVYVYCIIHKRNSFDTHMDTHIGFFSNNKTIHDLIIVKTEINRCWDSARYTEISVNNRYLSILRSYF